MGWTIRYSEIAAKQLMKLDKNISKKIINYLNERVIKNADPRSMGKALLHDKSDLWRYRVEDYRIICSIEDQELFVCVLRLGHRKNIYD